MSGKGRIRVYTYLLVVVSLAKIQSAPKGGHPTPVDFRACLRIASEALYSCAVSPPRSLLANSQVSWRRDTSGPRAGLFTRCRRVFVEDK
jgi:hypothetical protein